MPRKFDLTIIDIRLDLPLVQWKSTHNKDVEFFVCFLKYKIVNFFEKIQMLQSWSS